MVRPCGCLISGLLFQMGEPFLSAGSLGSGLFLWSNCTATTNQFWSITHQGLARAGDTKSGSTKVNGSSNLMGTYPNVHVTFQVKINFCARSCGLSQRDKFRKLIKVALHLVSFEELGKDLTGIFQSSIHCSHEIPSKQSIKVLTLRVFILTLRFLANVAQSNKSCAFKIFENK